MVLSYQNDHSSLGKHYIMLLSHYYLLTSFSYHIIILLHFVTFTLLHHYIITLSLLLGGPQMGWRISFIFPWYFFFWIFKEFMRLFIHRCLACLAFVCLGNVVAHGVIFWIFEIKISLNNERFHPPENWLHL